MDEKFKYEVLFKMRDFYIQQVKADEESLSRFDEDLDKYINSLDLNENIKKELINKIYLFIFKAGIHSANLNKLKELEKEISEKTGV